MVSESRETTFDYDIADAGALEPILDRAGPPAVRHAGPPGAPRAHDRDQGPARRLLDPHPGADARRTRSPRRTGCGRWRWSCCAGSRRRGRSGCWGCAWRAWSRRPRRGAEQLEPDRLGRQYRAAGQPAPRLAGQRVLHAELVQDADDDAADVVARRRRRSGSCADQQIERALVIAGVQRRERVLRRPARRRPARARSGRRARRRRSCRAPRASSASAASCRRGRTGSAPAAPRRRRATARARRRGAATPRRRRRPARRPRRAAASPGTVDRRRRLGADELGDDRPSRNALTAGMLWIRNARATPRVGVDVELDELDLCRRAPRPPARAPGRAGGTGRTIRPRSRRRPAPSCERSMTAVWKVLSVTSMIVIDGSHGRTHVHPRSGRQRP